VSQPLLSKTSDGRELIHIHIPKNAGMSIWEVVDLPSGVPQDVTHRVAYGWRRYLGAERYDAAYSFAVVRHPLDRLLSAWSYLRNAQPCRCRREDRLVTPEAQQAREWVQQWSTFEQFVLEVPESALEERTHFGPQWHYLYDPFLRLMVTRLLRFEHLAEDWKELCEEIGVDVELPSVNTSTHPPWQESYTQPMLDRAGDLYRRDFRLLPYQNDSAQESLAIA